MLSERQVIDFDAPDALPQLRHHLAGIIAARAGEQPLPAPLASRRVSNLSSAFAIAEGLMLKPLNSTYNDYWKPMKWVKLKKDFIPGAGDTLDFHLIGARWDRDRGRELVGQYSTARDVRAWGSWSLTLIW